jgi:multiple sugar transport system ATP-binding protein
MGRAIVREPKAFLMDEPLSNLDAKLRVSMRTSLQQLHRRIGTTTVYVTHDQVEAMTLGARVAVMQDGRVQQVDAPTVLYDQPANIFVAAFIGSPAMNLVKATLTEETATFGSISIPLDPDRRPPAQPGGQTIIGLRPESFEDAAFAEAGLPQIEIEVEVVEKIGSDSFVFFEIDAEQVVVEAALTDTEEDATLLTNHDQSLFVARVDARTEAAPGRRMRLAVNPRRMYFFSESGEALLDRPVAAPAGH